MLHSCTFQPRHHTVRVAFLIKIAKTAHVFRRIVKLMETIEESVFIDRCNMQTGYNVHCRKTYNNIRGLIKTLQGPYEALERAL